MKKQIRKTTKTIKEKLLAFALCFSLVFGILPIGMLSVPIEAEAAVSRDDGTWLFPLSSGYYNSFTDWAGCPGYGRCSICGVTHSSAWGDGDHTGQSYGHNGIDVGAGYGTNVLAAAPGYVYYVNTNWQARGYTVVMEHAIGNGWSYYSIYQHLSQCNVVANGSYVNAGTVIAKTGNTGGSYTYGNHLHFGIVMGQSGQGANVANMNTNTLNALEGAGWITSSGYRNGRILNNPASSNDAGYPTGLAAVIAPLRAHYGSVHYTFNASKVTIGNTTPSKPTLQSPVVNADSVTFTWNACTNTDDYDLYIYNHSGEKYKAIFDINSTQYTISGSEIPDGSYFFAVAATHNSSGNYTFSDQKAFYVNNTRRIFLESEDGNISYQPKIKMKIDDVNTDRGAGQTIIYTSDYRKATNTNYWGRELAVDKTGKVVATREYQDPNALAIPDGGFVISMHSGDAYIYQISIGDYAAFNRSTRMLYVYADESQYKLLTKTINREEIIGALPVFTWEGMALNGWKMKGQLIDVYTTKLSEDTVLQADWVIDRIRGDADGNSSITAEDALTILKHVVGAETLTEAALESADVDANSQITAEDALAVLKKVVGVIGSFKKIKVAP